MVSNVHFFKMIKSDSACSGPGLKPIIEAIDNKSDFKVYMQNYAIATNRQVGPRREGPWEEGFVSIDQSWKQHPYSPS